MFYFALKSLKTNLQEINPKAGNFSLFGVTCINYHLTLGSSTVMQAFLYPSCPKTYLTIKDIFDHQKYIWPSKWEFITNTDLTKKMPIGFKRMSDILLKINSEFHQQASCIKIPSIQNPKQ